MHVFNLREEAKFDLKKHVENILGVETGGDFTVACWEPGQISPYHCHPDATEIYFCFEGGGEMHTPETSVPVTPGSFVVHPPGELHEYVNGPERTLLFRVRYGEDMGGRTIRWRGQPDWKPRPQDEELIRQNPVP